MGGRGLTSLAYLRVQPNWLLCALEKGWVKCWGRVAWRLEKKLPRSVARSRIVSLATQECANEYLSDQGGGKSSKH